MWAVKGEGPLEGGDRDHWGMGGGPGQGSSGSQSGWFLHGLSPPL